MTSGAEMILEMRKNLKSYSEDIQTFVMQEWVDLIYQGIAKNRVNDNWELIPYLQYEDGTIVE
jgi:predicted transcriptional regulator